MKSTELKKIVDSIRADIKAGTFNPDNYIEFKEKSKILYEMTVNEQSFNQEIFDKFIGYLRRIENGEDPYGVDVEVGKFMATKYIDPVVEKLNK